MSFSKFVGRCTLLGLVVFLFVKGALVLRPKETIAALSALIAALVHACCGASSAPEPSAQNRAALEERRERDLVGDRQSGEGREGDVHRTVFDDAQVLGVEPGDLGSLFLGQFSLLAELPKTKPKATLGAFDGRDERRAKLHLRTPMIAR